jgi:hypothetical protein
MDAPRKQKREKKMILIRFSDAGAKRRALETLVGEFPFKSWSSGEMLVPEGALSELARNDIPFSFEGSAGYERLATLRDTPAPVLQ